MTHADFIRLGGAESAEIVMWMAMRGALPAHIRALHESYYLATSTAMGVGLYEGVPEKTARAPERAAASA